MLKLKYLKMWWVGACCVEVHEVVPAKAVTAISVARRILAKLFFIYRKFK